MEIENMIEIRNLTKIYRIYEKPIDRLKESLSITHKKYSKEFYALNNISLDIKKGESIGIIGTNGSGKSTLLKIITGVLSPTNGLLKVNGKISALLELGAGFNPEYTGIENIHLNGTMMGYHKDEIEAKIDSILQFADIGDFINQPVKTYSSGMFVRLAFSVAINVDPDILIIDEALSVGDYRFQMKCYKKINDFREMGKTILLVTHDVDSVKKFCNRSIWVEWGVLKADGDTKSVTALYIKSLHQVDGTISKTAITNGNKIKESKFEAITRFGKRNDAIRYVNLLDEDLQEKKIINKDTEIILELIVDIQEEDLISDNVTIAFSIKNKKGQDIFVYSLLNDNIKIEHAGRYNAQFKFKNFLVAGEYYISASYEIRDTISPEYIDYIDGAYYFKVITENVCYGLFNLPVETSLVLEEKY